MVDPKAPVARNVPKRVDTGRVDPTDYTPSDKVAPIPAVASGIADKGETLADETLEVAPSFARVKKPTQAVVDTVKKAVETVRGEPSKRLSGDARKRLIAEEDNRRMRAVRRYAKSIRETAVIPVIGGLLASKGFVPSGSPEGDYEAELQRIITIKVVSGRRVMKSGEERYRELDIASHLAYTLGRGSLSFEDTISEQWLKHPVVADILLTVMGVASVVASIYFKEIATTVLGEFFAKAINFAPSVEEPIKTDARVSDVK